MVIGALGAIPRDLEKHLKTLGLNRISHSQLQKAVLLGTAQFYAITSEIPIAPRRGLELQRSKNYRSKLSGGLRIRRIIIIIIVIIIIIIVIIIIIIILIIIIIIKSVII